MLTILHAPGHAPDMWPRIAAQARRTGADSIAFTEAYRLAGKLSARRYAEYVGATPLDTRAVRSPHGDAGDNPILVRRRHKVTRHLVRHAAAPGRPRKYAPARYVNAVTYRWQGDKVCHIVLHPSPLFCGKLAWLRVMHKGLREARRALRLNHHVVITGDLQTRRMVRAMMRALGLRSWRQGVDWIIYSRSLTLHTQQLIHPKGMDHPWMLARFIKAGK